MSPNEGKGCAGLVILVAAVVTILAGGQQIWTYITGLKSPSPQPPGPVTPTPTPTPTRGKPTPTPPTPIPITPPPPSQDMSWLRPYIGRWGGEAKGIFPGTATAMSLTIAADGAVTGSASGLHHSDVLSSPSQRWSEVRTGITGRLVKKPGEFVVEAALSDNFGSGKLRGSIQLMDPGTCMLVAASSFDEGATFEMLSHVSGMTVTLNKQDGQ
jgi:hypothetical protein